MGTEEVWFEGDGEGPVREVVLSPYQIAATAVTNDEFAAFAEATGHVTIAEREGWSFVFGGLLPDDFQPTRGVVGAEWWRQVEGACWSRPEGPQSSVKDRGNHPVVHVSWFDAAACAAWYGARLSTEAEWEHAARGGLVQVRLPWGDEMSPDGRPRLNIWEGNSPATTPLRTATWAPPRWTSTSPTGSASTTAQGMCGSGAPTGSTTDSPLSGH